MPRLPARRAGSPVVVLVSFADVLGGAERSLLALAPRLGARGWTAVLACPPGALADAARRAGVTVEPLAVRATRRVGRHQAGRRSYSRLAVAQYLLAGLANAVVVARAARRHRARLLHSNSMSSHVAVALAGRLTGRPVVWHLREMTRPGPGRRVLTTAGRLTSRMIAISRPVADALPGGRTVVIHNPVEAPATPPRPADWDVPRPVVGYLGRLDRGKGIEDLLTAAGRIDAHVVVVGASWGEGPEYLRSLQERAAQAAPGRVHFVGATDDPWSALAAMDVLVVPSLAEPFGRVAAEGQIAGVPVVAAAAGGLPEIVTDGRDGVLFPPGDAGALAACLERLLGDAELRRGLAEAGRAGARRFDPERHADAVAALYAGCLIKGPHPGPVGAAPADVAPEAVTHRH